MRDSSCDQSERAPARPNAALGHPVGTAGTSAKRRQERVPTQRPQPPHASPWHIQPGESDRTRPHHVPARIDSAFGGDAGAFSAAGETALEGVSLISTSAATMIRCRRGGTPNLGRLSEARHGSSVEQERPGGSGWSDPVHCLQRCGERRAAEDEAEAFASGEVEGAARSRSSAMPCHPYQCELSRRHRCRLGS